MGSLCACARRTKCCPASLDMTGCRLTRGTCARAGALSRVLAPSWTAASCSSDLAQLPKARYELLLGLGHQGHQQGAQPLSQIEQLRVCVHRLMGLYFLLCGWLGCVWLRRLQLASCLEQQASAGRSIAPSSSSSCRCHLQNGLPCCEASPLPFQGWLLRTGVHTSTH